MNYFQLKIRQYFPFLSYKYLKNILTQKDSINFIVINILVSFLGFVRSFFFMRILNLRELGLITLIQTGASLVGFFQIGLINGGYRIIAIQEKKSTDETNNVVFSYFYILSLGLLVFFIAGWILNYFSENLIVLLSILTGILLLVNNWLSNTLIAKRSYKLLNKSKLVAAIVTTACIPLVFWLGVLGGAIVILIQPIINIIFIFVGDIQTLPSKYDLKIDKIRKILHYGFIPYISALFLLIYSQIERWSINSVLGTVSLGKLYLVYMIASLWGLIPVSLLNLFFPRAALLYEQKNLEKFNDVVKKHFFSLLIYNLVGISSILFFLSTFVSIIFPKHLPYVKYVFLAFPGFFFQTLVDPISLVLNSVVKLQPLFWSSVSSLLVYSLLVIYLILTNQFSLISIIICLDIYYGFKFIYVYISYFNLKKKLII